MLKSAADHFSVNAAAHRRSLDVCVVLFPGVCLLCWSDMLLARPGQQRVRLLATGQTQRIQHDRLWR